MPASPPSALASLRLAQRALDAFVADEGNARRIDEVAGVLARCFAAGGKVMICGNGGSACDAMHFAEELTGRFRAPGPGRPDRPALPAMACTDPGHLTCVANDYGFEMVFSRWVEAFGRAGDVLIALSTSGNSENVVRAVATGRERGMRTAALLGGDGGRLRGSCEFEWVVGAGGGAGAGAGGDGGARLPADRVQEVHMVVLHALIEMVEQRLAQG